MLNSVDPWLNEIGVTAQVRSPTDLSASEKSVSSATNLDEFIAGARTCLPATVASAPFGLLFGALAIENGFSIFETCLMSLTVFAGASQMVGLELFGQKVAPWLIVVSIFAVNFRHVLYSASLGRRISHWPLWQQALSFFVLADPPYAEAERRAEQGKRITFAWYSGVGAMLYVCWQIETLLGAIFGSLLPNKQALGIDFLLPIYFLGLVMGFRKRPRWLPIVLVSAAASMLAYRLVGSPWHVSIGALAGIVLAAALPLQEAKDETP
ncbi:AzlC family ABC transporter permease [Tianweitania sp. Rool2]|uniref:AzlC family ABC transporter permease n=1 Tax=Oryzicola mucosus TaxID=2767425 RepID=A0A8J6U1Q1_9HYPH|nr:AzlC family ABC transporter permease [Oryzicola mucosus]